MKEVKGLPPNYRDIKSAGLADENSIFCYGENVYNNTGKEIPPDTLFHESIHAEQQKHYADPLLWWTQYLSDGLFRQKAEVEAYAKQYLWVKKHLGTKASDGCLDELAENLASPMYNLGLSFHQAHTLIRKEAQKKSL